MMYIITQRYFYAENLIFFGDFVLKFDLNLVVEQTRVEEERILCVKQQEQQQQHFKPTNAILCGD